MTSFGELFRVAQSGKGNHALRATSRWAIGRLTPKGWIRVLGKALATDADPEVTHQAVEALTASGHAMAVKAIKDALLRGKHPINRATAAWGLGMLHSRSAVAGLIAALRRKKEGPTVKAEAAEALGYIRCGLLLACVCVSASQVGAEAPACRLLDNSGAKLATLGRAWHEDWPLERLQALWGRKPDNIEQDATGTLPRAEWSDGGASAGCSVSVNVGDAHRGRAIDVRLTGVPTIPDAIRQISVVIRVLGVPEQPRILKEARAGAARNKTGWSEDYLWANQERRDPALGGTTTLEVQLEPHGRSWNILCRHLRLIAPPP